MNPNYLQNLLTPNFTGSTNVSNFLPNISPTAIPTTITPLSLAPVAPLPVVTTTPTPPPNITNLPNGLLPDGTLPPPPDPANTQGTAVLDRISALTGGNQAVDTQTAIDKATAPYQSQLNEINQQIQMHQANSIQAQEQAINRVGGTTGSNSIAAQQQQRTDAIETLKLSALAAGMQGNIALAEKHATNTVNAQYADNARQIQNAKTNIYTNYDSFTPAEKKRADATLLSLDSQDALVKQHMEEAKTNAAIIQTAIQQGATNGKPVPSILLSQAQKLTDPTQVTALLAPYLVDAAGIQKNIDAHNVAVANIAQSNAAIRKINSEIQSNGIPPVTSPNVGQYAGALSVILGSTKLTKDQKASLVNAVNNGEDPVAVLKNQAKSVMTGANQTKVESYEIAQSSLQNVADELQKFYDAGGKTSLFSGTYEKTINKLGEVSDPKLVELATQIQQSLQIYRNAVSGTAYSVQEGNDIASIFPGIQKGQLLNNSIIKGRMKAFDDGIDGAYKSVLGSTYDSLKTFSPTSTKTSSFDQYANDITPATSGTNAYMPRSVWTNVTDKDGLIAYVKSLGYNLLIQ